MPGAIIYFESVSPLAGGREKVPLGPHYRPHLRVGDGEYLGVEFRGKESEFLMPKAGIETTVDFAYYPKVDYAALKAGSQFQVLEGRRIVGVGIVKEQVS